MGRSNNGSIDSIIDLPKILEPKERLREKLYFTTSRFYGGRSFHLTDCLFYKLLEQSKVKHYPLVTIIAICHNHKPYVVETLDSIRNQTYPNIQCIIINNLKDDGCREVIEAWIEKYQYEALFIQSQQPLSVTQNFNLGLKHTNGKYFQGVSCDDVLLNSKIEKQVKKFEILKEKYCCIYTDELRIDENGNPYNNESLFEERLKSYELNEMPRGNLLSFFSEVAFISPVSCLFRTKIIKRFGYDENFIIEDWPMYLELSRNGYYFDYINEKLVKYRILSTSLSHNRNWQYHLEHLKIYYKFKRHIIMSQKVKIKIRRYLIDVAKSSPLMFFYYYLLLFDLIPKDIRSNLIFIWSIFRK